MQTAVAEKEAGMTEWNEGRLDDLGDRVDRIEKKMDAGFVQTDQKMEAGFSRADQKMDDGFARLDKKMDGGFARVDSRLDALNSMMVRSVWTFGVGMLAFAGSLLGIIATKF